MGDRVYPFQDKEFASLAGKKGGRPAAKNSIPDLLRNIGLEPANVGALEATINQFFPNSDLQKMNNKEVLMRLTYINAFTGNDWAIKFIAERTEGKVPIKKIIQNVDIIDAVIKAIQEVELPKEFNDRLLEKLIDIGEIVE